MHARGKLHRTYLPWGQLNFLPEKTSKRCLKAFFHRGTRAAAELSADWFPGFRNQVHFLDFLPSLSPASARETVFLDVPLALTPCGYTGPKFGSEQTLFGAHTSRWFPCKQGSGGTCVMGPHVLFLLVLSIRTRRKGSVENSNWTPVTLVILALTWTHLGLSSLSVRLSGEVRVGCRDAPRSPGAVKIQIGSSVCVGKSVQHWSQTCPRTVWTQLCYLSEVLIPISLSTSPSSIASIRIMKMLESLDSVAFSFHSLHWNEVFVWFSLFFFHQPCLENPLVW